MCCHIFTRSSDKMKSTFNEVKISSWLQWFAVILLQLHLNEHVFYWFSGKSMTVKALYSMLQGMPAVVHVTLGALSLTLGGVRGSCFFHLGKKLQSEGIPQWEQTDHRGGLLSMGLSTPRLPESLSHHGSHKHTHTHTYLHTLASPVPETFPVSLWCETTFEAPTLEFPQLI